MTIFIIAKFFTTWVIFAHTYPFSLNMDSLQQEFILTSNYLGTNAIVLKRYLGVCQLAIFCLKKHPVHWWVLQGRIQRLGQGVWMTPHPGKIQMAICSLRNTGTGRLESSWAHMPNCFSREEGVQLLLEGGGSNCFSGEGGVQLLFWEGRVTIAPRGRGRGPNASLEREG